MPSNFVQREFRVWLERNRSRFEHPPAQIRYIRGEVTFSFTGIIPEISASINKYGCDILFTYQNEVWDLLECFDVLIAHDKQGYYCAECIMSEGSLLDKLFDSRADLMCDHVFEPLLKWSNSKLGAGVVAQLNQATGATWVELISKENFESLDMLDSGEFSNGYPALNQMTVIQSIAVSTLRATEIAGI